MHGIDGQFDFPLNVGTPECFRLKSSCPLALVDQWKISQAAWRGSASVMANMVGNHDVTRFISEAMPSGANRYNAWHDPAPAVDDSEAHGALQLALAFVITMPGVATLYYGDEIGIAGGRDPDNRRPMRFPENVDKRRVADGATCEATRELRRCMSPFNRDPVEFLRTEAERLAYLTLEQHSEDALLVVLSRSPKNSMDLQIEAASCLRVVEWSTYSRGMSTMSHGGHIRDISTRHNQVVALVDTENPCAQIGDAQR